MPSLRWQLLLALRDTLRQISPANGYLTQPRIVEIGLRSFAQITAHPAIFLVEGSGALHPNDTHTSRDHHFRVNVHLFVASNSSVSREQAIQDLNADVYQRCVEDDPTLGGLAIHTDEAGPDESDSGVLGLTGLMPGNEGEYVKELVIMASEPIRSREETPV
jgi:hypothetical protein